MLGRFMNSTSAVYLGLLTRREVRRPVCLGSISAASPAASSLDAFAAEASTLAPALSRILAMSITSPRLTRGSSLLA